MRLFYSRVMSMVLIVRLIFRYEGNRTTVMLPMLIAQRTPEQINFDAL